MTALEQYMPHGMCYLWELDLLLTHTLSDFFIALAYMVIGSALGTNGSTVLLLFKFFILFCGLGHLLSILVVWEPYYWIQAANKVITAILSVSAAWLILSKHIIFYDSREVLRRGSDPT